MASAYVIRALCHGQEKTLTDLLALRQSIRERTTFLDPGREVDSGILNSGMGMLRMTALIKIKRLVVRPGPWAVTGCARATNCQGCVHHE